MGFFLRAVAVLVGLAHIYGPLAVEVLSDPAALSRVYSLSILPSPLLVAVPGLLVAEVVLRLMRPELEGEFPLRYVVIVFGVCLGGVLMGALMGFLLGLGALQSGASEEAIGVAVLGASIGGVVGLGEGLILAIPLAAILGLFRNRNGSRSRTTAT